MYTTASNWVDTGYSLELDVPTKFALTSNGTTWTIYINGSPIFTSSTTSIPNLTGTHTIGGYTNHADTSDFTGQIKQVMIFNRELSTDEVVKLSSIKPAII